MNEEFGSAAWGMDFGDDTDLGNVDSGGRVPDGYHRAKVAKLSDDEDGHKHISFEVTAGPARGGVQSERLNNPSLGRDDKARKGAAKRAKLIMSRLGLLTPAVLGDRSALIEWDKAIGREVVIRVQTRSIPKRPDGSGGGEFTGLAYEGIYPLDHPDIPAQVRTELGLPPARARLQSDGPSVATGAANAPAPVNDADADAIFGK